MKPDKDYTGAVNSLAAQIIKVARRKIKSKQTPFAEVLFISTQAYQAAQNICANPTSFAAHINACACANLALGVAITIDDEELINDTRTLKDVLELHFRCALFDKEEGESVNG